MHMLRHMRSRRWRWCWALGLVVLCSYIAFEVLDLDGSDLPRRLGLGGAASAMAQAEAERVFRIDLAAPNAWTPLRPSTGMRVLAPPRGRTTVREPSSRHRGPLPRRVLAPTVAGSPIAPSDPA
jgi:hypothetical protein